MTSTLSRLGPGLVTVRRLLLGAALVVPSLATPAFAADTTPVAPGKASTHHLHDGFYLRMAVGVGAFSSRDVVDGSPAGQPTFAGGGSAAELTIGGALRPGFVLAASGLWQSSLVGTLRDEAGQATLTRRHDFVLFGPTIDLFPWPRRGFHVLATLGPAVMGDYRDDRVQKTWTTRTGGGLSIGAGYDAWVSANWSLGFLVRATGATLDGSERTYHDDQTYTVTRPDTQRSVGAISITFTALYQ